MNHEKIYLFVFRNNNWIQTRAFAGKAELISFLAANQNREVDFRSGKPYWNNTYLDQINLSSKDLYSYYEWNKDDRELFVRPYLFVREDNAIVDVRQYYREILLEKEKKSGSYDYRYYKEEYLKRRYPQNIPTFRKDPIPGLHKKRSKRRTPYRHMKYKNILKMVKNPEFKEWGRPGRFDWVCDTWSDPPLKHREKSWKYNSKKEKQWG